MKIAMPHLDGKLNPHFGTSREFIVFDSETAYNRQKIITNETLHNHGGLARMLKAEGANVVIAGGIGKPMAQALEQRVLGCLQALPVTRNRSPKTF
jgi:predicted Fe-Mo cluster-binding NifX family protein